MTPPASARVRAGGTVSSELYDSMSKTTWLIQNRHNSMYTLIHDGQLDNDATNLLTQILDRNWTTGPLLFEK